MIRLRIVTYNVHGGIGLDGRWLPARQLDLLRGLAPDVVALQEFVNGAGTPGHGLVDAWAAALGMEGRFAPGFVRRGREFGNAILSRFPVVRTAEHDISAPGGFRRIALEAHLALAKEVLRVVCVHCGVRVATRALQRPLLLAIAAQREGSDASVLLGDFNEWNPADLIARGLAQDHAGSGAGASFPSLAPAVALDRIWVHPPSVLLSSAVFRGRGAAWASDHLPVIADLELP